MSEESKPGAPKESPGSPAADSSKERGESRNWRSIGCTLKLIVLMLMVPGFIVWGIVQAIIKLLNGH